ncbi:hypothetical protein ABT160_45835 [Streptomyces sp. NPDC001941]|uniref:hypothetical protein n=1 Tax=Streptomyces sp. NPDC001941 TaxID=3154659 RepID=UPI00331E0AF1
MQVQPGIGRKAGREKGLSLEALLDAAEPVVERMGLWSAAQAAESEHHDLAATEPGHHREQRGTYVETSMTMIPSDAAALLCGVREALRAGGLSQPADEAGLPVLAEAETWLAGQEVILKVGVAPEERPGAGAIPGRVQHALRSRGFALALASGSPAAASGSAAGELGSGRAVRVVRVP